ncbi:MAG: dienelactone hydrolase family protein, partial [Caulobacteraceae bacterium]|nr:dienelactone hydrolase family protein [Caulobacteraceae bacterium]
PDGAGPWPAVILYMDALAIRPALKDMAERMASYGFVVLLPDLFYRAGPYAPLDPKVVFAGDVRAAIAPLAGTTSNAKAAEDTAAFIAYLDTRKDVKGRKIGVTGYCMGGGMAIAAAAAYPDRIAAAATYHGGALANDSKLSPHLGAPRIKAKVYIGVAENDNSYPPEMAERFERALKDAGVDYVSELYEGAAHGWTQTDFPVHNAAAEEEHWRTLIGLFRETLG